MQYVKHVFRFIVFQIFWYIFNQINGSKISYSSNKIIFTKLVHPIALLVKLSNMKHQSRLKVLQKLYIINNVIFWPHWLKPFSNWWKYNVNCKALLVTFTNKYWGISKKLILNSCCMFVQEHYCTAQNPYCNWN